MNTCVIYYRVSTKEQSDKWSLPAQRSELTTLAEKNNWKILKEYTEVKSAENIKDRVVIQQLIEDIPSLAPDYICVVEQDRLSRGDDFFWLKQILRDANIKIATPVTITDPDIEESDLASDVIAIIAKYERRKIITRIKRAKIEMIKEGYHNSPPIGYDRDNRSLKVNPSEAVIVNKIFDVYIKTCSAREVHEYLKEHNIKTKKGNNFIHSSIVRLIKNQTYIGMTRHKKTWYQGRHEPIVDRDKFDMANRIMQANYRIKSGNNIFLKGLIYCAHCGHKMTTSKSNKGQLTYRCYKRIEWGKLNCISVIVDKKRVDDYVWNLVIKRLRKLRPILAENRKIPEHSDNSVYIRKLRKRLRILETDYYVGDRISKDRFEEIRKDLLSKIVELEDHKEETVDYSYLKDIDFNRLSETTIEEKRAIACSVIKRITVSKSDKNYFDTSRLSIEFYS
jgi:site-specific DNA recombinase